VDRPASRRFVTLSAGERLNFIGGLHSPLKENPFRPGVFSIGVFDPDGHEIELIFEPWPAWPGGVATGSGAKSNEHLAGALEV
jgi:hypothetical protein